MSLLELFLRWLHLVIDSESPGRTIWRTVVGAAVGGLLGIAIPTLLVWLFTLGSHDKTGAGGIAMARTEHGGKTREAPIGSQTLPKVGVRRERQPR